MKPEDILKIAQRELEARKMYRYHIYVCCSTGCSLAGGQQVLKAFEEAVRKVGLQNECRVSKTGCQGICAFGPVVSIDPGGYFYQRVTPKDVERIVREHIVNGRPVNELLYPSEDFFRKQLRLVLRNAGKIDPFKIEDYIAFGGYTALIKCLTKMSPEDVIEEIIKSGLRGRGGAGFPTGQKWKFVAKEKATPKYVIANLDEGDPGVFANRTLAETDPHAIIEGMIIAAYAVGARKGYIYIRAEYPLAVQTLREALKQARNMNLLGENILETGFSFDLELRLGAGAFVAGEETGIIASIEGRRAMPRPRPPYPATSGLWGKPTLINNVETFANVPLIILNGGEWFAKIGTPTCTGTKCFSLTGKIRYPGLIEVPMGITLREIIFEIGGGLPPGRKFKAVLIGGPSGGCLPESLLDLPIDYESLTEAGAIMGSGGIVVIDDESCIVDTAWYFTDFCVDESCGKCTPCRVGLPKMKSILERIMRGEGRLEDIEKLEELGEYIKEVSLCGLGQTAPNPILTTIRYFRDEYIAHIVDKRCPANKCFSPQKGVKEVQ